MRLPYVVSTNVQWVSGKAELASRFVKSRLHARAYRDKTRGLRAVCLFIGYPRSGHSLVGSLIDAHRNCVIANELDVLKYANAGFDRDQLAYLLLRNSEDHSRHGRVEAGYNYDVPNQWQGRVEELRVLGDKKGGMSTQRISRNPDIIEYMRVSFGAPVKFIHVVRNPFDNITTMAQRTDSSITEQIIHYFELCIKNAIIAELAGGGNVLNVRHEDIVANPEGALREIAAFLEIEPDEGYLRDCASIVYTSPHKSREKHSWTDFEKQLVLSRSGQFPFLNGYTFEH